MWASLIKRYWQVSIFKETPDNTPYSLFLLGLICIFFYFLIVIQWVITDIKGLSTTKMSMITALLLLISYSGYTALLLMSFRLSNRIVQTLTCILAGHTIVHLCAFPLLFFAPWFIHMETSESLILIVGVIYLILTFALTIWQFMITVHIYKQALAIEYFPAILASIGLIACNILVISFWR